jgi:rSAM/selenodomain-associated transferase 1
MATMGAKGRALIVVLAKAPVPGQVKTRLMPRLGPVAAAQLYARLVKHTLATSAMSRVGPLELWCAPDPQQSFFEACRRTLGLSLRAQPEGDIGARMSEAARDALMRATTVVMIGADVPSLTLADLRDACGALEAGHDAVLGPAEDGGYYLIGLRRHDPTLFEGIAWSTRHVLEATRQRLRRLGWRWHELPTRWDIDRPEDIDRLQAHPHLSWLLGEDTAPSPNP